MEGANDPLIQCQQEYANSRKCEKGDATPEQLGFVRDPQWRPQDPETDRMEEPRHSVDNGMAYADDPTVYYYWRSQR